MARYFFNWKMADRVISDLDGTELPTLAAAHEHARGVAAELMQNRQGCGAWRLHICDDQGRDRGDLLFATVGGKSAATEWEAGEQTQSRGACREKSLRR